MKIKLQPSTGVSRNPPGKTSAKLYQPPLRPRLANSTLRGNVQLQMSTIRSYIYVPTAWWWQKGSVHTSIGSVEGKLMMGKNTKRWDETTAPHLQMMDMNCALI